jgi:hypothetical protein
VGLGGRYKCHSDFEGRRLRESHVAVVQRRIALDTHGKLPYGVSPKCVSASMAQDCGAIAQGRTLHRDQVMTERYFLKPLHPAVNARPKWWQFDVAWSSSRFGLGWPELQSWEAR